MKHRSRSSLGLLAGAAFVAAMTPSSPAEACGGCFVQESENTQVTSHRMVMSISPEETTLWDQIVYDGDPEEFAWVLPIRGEVEVGLSSETLFEVLETQTAKSIQSPLVACGGANGAASADGAGEDLNSSSGGSKGSEYEDPVEVLSHEVVGPFETVQLESSDPQALNQWLLDHGYDVPEDVQPIVVDYVEEGFNFLALRLVPGAGVDAMRPVRVTSQGASPTLPLRMVAAGTGATTPITLWVIAEGRYQPANMDNFTIEAIDLVWDWDTSSSNYTTLRQAGFDAADGGSWLTEAALPLAPYWLDTIATNAITNPGESGYGDANGQGAGVEAAEDHEKLIGKLDRESMWITRLYGEIARPKLGQDLELEAGSQETVELNLLAERAIGTEPSCPPPNNPPPGTGGDGGSDGGLGPSSCAHDPQGGGDVPTGWLLGAGAMLVIGNLARRRRR